MVEETRHSDCDEQKLSSVHTCARLSGGDAQRVQELSRYNHCVKLRD
jgi:hypothetical protein